MSGDLDTSELARSGVRTRDGSSRVSRARAFLASPTGLVIVAATALALAIRLFTLTRPGYLTGVTEYDDGVYLGGAVRLLQGAVPYHDYAFVQPPGILVLMAPVAFLAKVTSMTHGMAAARVLTALASTACVPLAGGLARHRGALVTLATCGILAVYPDDITTAHTLILEPWMNLLLLIGVSIAFRSGRLASTRRLAWAGVVVGVAGAIKFWAALPAAVLLVVCLAAAPSAQRWRHALSYAAGVAAGFLVIVLPFALTAPVTFVRSTLLDQASRAGTYVPRSMRLAHITGLIDFLNGNGRLSLTAGTHSLFASGGTAATVGGGAGVLPYLIALAGVAVVAAGYVLRPGRPSPLEAFALVTAVLATAAVVMYSAFFYHYADFGAPWIALAAGGAFGAVSSRVPGDGRPARWAAGVLSARRTQNVLFGFIGLILILLATFQARELAGLTAQDVYADQAVIPPGACVVTDQVSMTVAANRFTTARPGCPDIIDALAQTLVLSNGVSVQGGVASMPKVVAAWQTVLSKADYVWLSPNNGRRIPWTPALTSWFHANFIKLATPGGLGDVYKRA